MTMLNSAVLDVAIGLIFAFLAVSLAVSAIVEAIASVLSWRSKTLLKGVKDLLNDAKFEGLARGIYNHALVNPQDSGTAKTVAELKYLPSYMDSRQFADALIDVTKITGAAPEKIKSVIAANVSDPQLKTLLEGVVDRTGGDAARMRTELAGWFDNAMDRVGGLYKRWTQLLSFAVALVIAIIFNVSAIGLGRALWQQPMLARTIAPTANQTSEKALDQLKELLEQAGELEVPVGWTSSKFHALWSGAGIETILGWLITAVATLFGAPFWFDALQQIVRLKGSGPSPAEKRADTGAAA
jgi:hypothetical protein